jgi:hypothetical protein
MGLVYEIYDLRAKTMDKNTRLRDPMSESEFAQCMNDGVSPRLYAVKNYARNLVWRYENDPDFTTRAREIHKLVDGEG